MVQQVGSQPIQHRLWNMTKFVKWYLCGVYGREIYPTAVLFSSDCLQISWYVNSHDNWFPILLYKVDVKLDVWCAMNIARIIWPICLQNNEFPPVCYTLWHHFCTLVKLQEIVCFFQPNSATSHTKNNPVHTLQAVLVNRIINGGFLWPSAPDLVVCDWFLVVRHFKGYNV